MASPETGLRPADAIFAPAGLAAARVASARGVDPAGRARRHRPSATGVPRAARPSPRPSGVARPSGRNVVEPQTRKTRSPAGARYETSIVGIWQNAAPPVVFANDMPLRGWQVYQIKPVVMGRGAENIIGFGTSAPMGFPNLGEVRRRVAQWSDEQTRRSRWQCTG